MSERFWTGVTIGGFGIGMWCLGCATGYWAGEKENMKYNARIRNDLQGLLMNLSETINEKLNENDEETKEQEEA